VTVDAALPEALYSAAEVGALDRAAIEDAGIPGIELMERAGAACFRAVAAWARRRAAPRSAARVIVLCGGGNNGGDGFVVARLAREAGMTPRVALLADPERLSGAARSAHERMRAAGVAARPCDDGVLADADVVVDAVFGTGLDRPPEGDHAAAIAAMNASAAPVVAVDVPSGLHADTGRVLGTAVRAAETVTFIGLKRGLFTGAGRDHCGRVRFDDLGVPAAVYAAVPPSARRTDLSAWRALLAPRERSAHKGRFGHVLVVGGDHGFAGAARLAGEAAARVGAGLVSIATRPAHVTAVTATRPELMCRGVEAAGELDPLLERASVVAVGPGLGRGEWSRMLLARVLASGLPLVADADALNLLGADGLADGAARLPDRWIITPHPGEAARLLETSTAEVQGDRFAAARRLAERSAAVVVLKGSGTVVDRAGEGDCSDACGDGARDGGAVHVPHAPLVCADGNPGLASGGTGDVLTGVLAGLAAQLLPRRTPLVEVAAAGVCLHARAADVAAAAGERGLLAGDLMPQLRRLANPP